MLRVANLEYLDHIAVRISAAPSTTAMFPFNLPMTRSIDPNPAGAQLVRMLGIHPNCSAT
jgi:hypothetical protein